MNKVTKTFTITTDPQMMLKIERFLAWLHFNSMWGHSATVAMDCDGDGEDDVTVEGEGIEAQRAYVDNLSRKVGKTKQVEYISANELTRS
jgi:hypothetical protein